MCTANEKFYIEDYFVAARADDDVDTDDDIIAGADRQVREDINQTEYLSQTRPIKMITRNHEVAFRCSRPEWFDRNGHFVE